ncbi:MAG TPA: hypothetical protein VGC95_12435 [Chitinophagaceae bacterium]
MTVLNKLASALGRRDEVPNQLLAVQIARENDEEAVEELVENLSNEDTGIQSDCIKVLYEIGALKPNLIAGHHEALVKLLDGKNNRLIWGAMTALDAITSREPKAIFRHLPKILAAADSGSVITRDHAVGILSKLASFKDYSKSCVPLLIEQLKTCPANQFPMYAEMSLAAVNDKNMKLFREAIGSRLERLEKESQKKRITRVLRKLAEQ